MPMALRFTLSTKNNRKTQQKSHQSETQQHFSFTSSHWQCAPGLCFLPQSPHTNQTLAPPQAVRTQSASFSAGNSLLCLLPNYNSRNPMDSRCLQMQRLGGGGVVLLGFLGELNSQARISIQLLLSWKRRKNWEYLLTLRGKQRKPESFKACHDNKPDTVHGFQGSRTHRVKESWGWGGGGFCMEPGYNR